MADRMALLFRGCLHLVGTPAEFEASDDPVVRQFLEGRTDGPIQVSNAKCKVYGTYLARFCR
jgi:phospholipid/cholesterol/gamma-HCH transport system ATP-binding protein